MQGSYSELRNTAVSNDLLERLLMAVTDVAIEVYMENPATPNHAARQTYAVGVAANPRSTAEQMKFAVVFLADDVTDAALRAAVVACWDAFAGVMTGAV